MKRFIPHPVLSAFLVLMWLVLTRFSLGHLLLGCAIALAASRAMAALHPETPRLRNPKMILRLIWRLFVDIIRSNIAVSRLILVEGRNSDRQSAFIEVPLTVRSQSALAVLAIMLTATPGTAWLGYVPDTGKLTLHIFDASEADLYLSTIHNIYEPMLKEIFE